MEKKDLIHTERKITIGMVISTEFLKRIEPIIDLSWVLSKEAKTIMSWCLEHYKKFEEAPGELMEEIYTKKLASGKIPDSTADMLEEILEDLSEEYDREQFNVDYLFKEQAIPYCKACKLKDYIQEIEDDIDDGKLVDAEAKLSTYTPVEEFTSKGVVPLSSPEMVRAAFESAGTPLFNLQGRSQGYGHMADLNMVRQGFVVYLAPNKSGKTFQLMKNVLRAAKQGCNVAFFQAGDMSEEQMNRRMAISASGRSDQERYCQPLYVPQIDCYYNLCGECDLKWREGGVDADHPFEGEDRKTILTDYSLSDYIDAFKEFPNHKPCYRCRLRKELQRHYVGAHWYRYRPEVQPISWKFVWHLMERKYHQIFRRIRLFSYSNSTLTMSLIYRELEILERQGFFADMCVVDYMDILEPDWDTKTMAPRDQENVKYKRGRKLSQDKNFLFMSASQSDTPGFDAPFLGRKNFSEDRRKLDHVTAMYGINMTEREKKKGIARINDIVGRDVEGGKYVHILHRLQMGQPVINSFY